MDMGTLVAKYLKKEGIKTNIEESEEINACSIHIELEAEDLKTGEKETIPYLLMFKNETHNHPTEVEPYGGASTCLGGVCIRDPFPEELTFTKLSLNRKNDPLCPWRTHGKANYLKRKSPLKRPTATHLTAIKSVFPQVS